MPTDETWQSSTMGYEDFGASSCSAADVTSHVCNMAGGTWDINPQDPTTTEYNPFQMGNGYLTLSAIPTPPTMVSAIQAEMTQQGLTGPVPSFVGAHMVPNPAAFNGFTYGYFEFRVAFPNAGQGMFPALWFYATPGSGARNPNKGHAEIDLLEFLGASKTFSTTVYAGGSGISVGSAPGYIDGQFHTYGMDWQADHMDFYFDQKLIYSAPAAAVTWFQGVPMSPLMDYVMDASWMASNQYLQANAQTPNPLNMYVNYVRLYSVKPF